MQELVAILNDILYNMKIYFFALLILFSKNGFSQLDSLEVKQFINSQYPDEQKFISFLKKGQIDSCLSKISTEAILKFGTEKLKTELQKLDSFYKKYGTPKYSSTIGNSVSRPRTNYKVGSFGHDVRGTIEKKCEYYFENKNGQSVYRFTLYYWNYQNFGIIKYFQVFDIEKFDNDPSNILVAPPKTSN
jgi:hypothetical protein